MAADNKSLGRFILDGIPPAPRGIPQIEVTFDIDANGILNVTAKDKATSKQQTIRIEGSSGISADEIERMKKEAEAHAAEDKAKKELIEAKNQAEQLVYLAEKTLKEAGDKVKFETRKDIEGKLEAVKKAREGSDATALKKSTEELSKAIQAVGQQMYQQQAAPNATQQGEPRSPQGERVVDGQAEEKK
jgi:molecular chaperone DnaK